MSSEHQNSRTLVGAPAILTNFATKRNFALQKVGFVKQPLNQGQKSLRLHAVRTSIPTESTLGGLGDWVPAGLRHEWRLAALASRCKACISAATTTITLAWEVVPKTFSQQTPFLLTPC